MNTIDVNERYKKICGYYGAAIILAGILTGIYNIINSTSYYVMLAFSFCAFAFIPFVFNKVFRLRPAYIIHFAIYAFSTLAFGIGMILNGYHLVPGYDKFVHFLSGIVFTLIGCCIFYIFKPRKKLEREDAPLTSLFSLCFSLAVACFWEIFEYVINFILHNDPQNVFTTGVNDTMQDIIACLLGSFAVAFSLWHYLARGRENFFSRILQSFCDINLTAK
ncbi:DUF2238 domain-containing protein [Lactonifactor longoviformis]|uniref:DUF2238 domain-containing protein n=1 Tax=Lactonifactor longoviformis TaxID=341220 RepID=UPI00210CFA6E|nr:DUF2238 domain-containing protein [Lactonifactor longoviformis]MCQ4673143.1 DUF2238 domain-containing protein [Lactonifactor longoviformis]